MEGKFADVSARDKTIVQGFLKMNPRNLKVAALFGLVVLLFGLNYIFVKIGLAYSPPVWLAFFRVLFGFLGAAALLYAMHIKGGLTAKQKLIALLIGVPGSALFFGLWFLGGTKVLPGLTSVIIYTSPLWIVVLSVLLLNERPKLLKIGAVLLGFLGVALAAQIGFANLTGDATALAEIAAAAFCFAFLNVAFKKYFKGEALLRANVYQLAGSLLPLLAWGALSNPFSSINWNLTLVEAILFLGVPGTAVALFIWFWLLSNYSPSTIGGYSFLTIVVALISSYFIFGEKITLIQTAGIAAIIVSIYLVSKT